MGARGPQPKPTKLKQLEGNPGKRKLPENEVQPIGGLARPSHVTGQAAEEWDRAVCAMPPGFYTAADVPVLAGYCVAWVLYRNALAIVAKDGMETVGSTGQKVAHPQLAVTARFYDVILKSADRLGMSPAARARLQMSDEENPDGEFAGLMGMKAGSAANIN